jgi:hypothetical protein
MRKIEFPINFAVVDAASAARFMNQFLEIIKSGDFLDDRELFPDNHQVSETQ